MKKKALTRKQTALRRLGQLFAVVVIVALYSGANLFPRQAVGDIAERVDLNDNKEFVECFYDPTLPQAKTALHYLVDGEQVMMLCTVKWNLFAGWYDWDWCKVETWDGAPLYAGLLSHTTDDQSAHYLFGRIDDEEIAELSLYFDLFTYTDDGTYVGKERSGLSLPKDAIFRAESGERYILTPITAMLPTSSEEDLRYQEIHLLGYDRSGTVIADEEVHWASWG